MLERCYWSHNGLHQEKADVLGNQVPAQGAAEDPDVELYRLLSNVYHDIYNNAGWNLATSRRTQLLALLGAADRYKDRVFDEKRLQSFLELLLEIAGSEDRCDQAYQDDELLQQKWLEALEDLADAVVLTCSK